jgi:electron transport complex protein RnfC
MFKLYKLFSPRGGVHPEPHKQHTADKPIARGPLPPRLYLPLRQHAGAAAEAIVNVGDNVLKGQLLAISAGNVSAPVHAPTSGTIVALEDIQVPHPVGLLAPGIILESDGDDKPATNTNTGKSNYEPFQEQPELLANRIAEAGIVGMGGAVFPSAVKLGKSREKVELVLLNGSECEPYLTADDLLMREWAEDIIDGARLIAYITGAPRSAIGIEDNKPEAIAAISKACESYSDIDVTVVPARYPMGSAKQLIHAVTGKEVPSGGRSSDIGVIMHNVATARAISHTLRRGLPLISRVVTVAGGAVKNPQNIEALIGTPMRDLIEQCGGLNHDPARLLMGGPMMGQLIHSLDAPVTKGSSGLLALAGDEVNATRSSACIRCARCVSACPMGLMPLEIASRAKSDDLDGAQDYGLADCILCGSCAYVCPSHIPLVHYFQYAKGELSVRAAEQRKVEYTRELSESRERRLTREAAIKAAEKAARAAAKKAKAEAAKKAREAKAAAVATAGDEGKTSTQSSKTADTAETA